MFLEEFCKRRQQRNGLEAGKRNMIKRRVARWGGGGIIACVRTDENDAVVSKTLMT